MTVLNQADAIYLGDQAVAGVYLGSDKVWPAAPPPPSGYVAAVLADNPTGFWPLDEASGTALADLTGSHPGTYNSTGVTLGVPGPIPGHTAAQFDGNVGYATLTTLGQIGAGIANSTWEFWMRTTEARTVRAIFGAVNTGTSVIYEIDLHTQTNNAGQQNAAAGQTLVFHRTAGNTVLWNPNPAMTEPIYDGTWRLLAARFSGTNAATAITWYVDGQLIVARGPYNLGTPINFDFPIMLGARNVRGIPAMHASAALAMFAVYPYALTDQQIADHWQAAQP